MYSDLIQLLQCVRTEKFEIAVSRIIEYVDQAQDFNALLTEIGIIPESLPYDSSEEKLFAKASDAVLARAFREIGLKATVLTARGNAADVFAESPIYGYTLVADAKAFRLSRTAKNQKDFKVAALSNWREDSEYAVLCAPYFQYPTKASQIYEQAIQHNVCLFSWEYLQFLIDNGIQESMTLSLEFLWNYSSTYSANIRYEDRQKCFFSSFDAKLVSTIGKSNVEFRDSLKRNVDKIRLRGTEEKEYLLNEKKIIEAYSREQAILELIGMKKINEKIRQIDHYIGGLQI